jgi:hypothetical protein
VESESQKLIQVNPEIPFPTDLAFFPIDPDLDGVYYSWRECARRLVICVKWEHKKVKFLFSDKEMMRFFKNGDFGFKKRQNP